jgi:hypothetical protein
VLDNNGPALTDRGLHTSFSGGKNGQRKVV